MTTDVFLPVKSATDFFILLTPSFAIFEQSRRASITSFRMLPAYCKKTVPLLASILRLFFVAMIGSEGTLALSSSAVNLTLRLANS